MRVTMVRREASWLAAPGPTRVAEVVTGYNLSMSTRSGVRMGKPKTTRKHGTRHGGKLTLRFKLHAAKKRTRDGWLRSLEGQDSLRQALDDVAAGRVTHHEDNDDYLQDAQSA